MLRRAFLLSLLVLTLAACGAPAQTPASPAAPLLEVTSAPTEEPAAPSPAPEQPTEEPAAASSRTPAPSEEPPTATAAAPSSTTQPTEAASPTPPLFLEPTPRSGSPPTSTAEAPQPTSAPAGAASAPEPTPAAQAAGVRERAPASSKPVRLVIDAIALDRSLVPVGLDRNRIPVVPDHDIGWYTLGAQPGQGENIVLWGHVLRFRATPNIPAPFARLKEVKAGAQVTLYDDEGRPYRYVVTEQVWATPDQVEYMLPRGRELVTMISCIGDKVIEDGSVEMTHRLITIAEPAR